MEASKGETTQRQPDWQGLSGGAPGASLPPLVENPITQCMGSQQTCGSWGLSASRYLKYGEVNGKLTLTLAVCLSSSGNISTQISRQVAFFNLFSCQCWSSLVCSKRFIPYVHGFFFLYPELTANRWMVLEKTIFVLCQDIYIS